MNAREVRREAHDAVAGLIGVNLDSGDGDLFVGVEHWDDDDLARFRDECVRIRDYHWRFGVSTR